MKSTTSPISHDASVEALHWTPRRVPPIGTGELDSLAVLRFETLDAIALAEAALAEIRALRDWARELQDRSSGGSFAAPALLDRVAAVAGVDLSDEVVDRLLSTLDDLLGHLDGGARWPVEAKVQR